MNSRPAAAQLGSRSLFPKLEARAYLAHAAIAPVSCVVEERVAAALGDYSRHGVLAFREWHVDRERLRGVLSTLIGAQADDLAFVTNTTDGVMQVAQCFDWKADDIVLLFGGEFPANVSPWQQAAKMFGLQLHWGKADQFRTEPEAALQALKSELERGVRLVAVSAVQFQTGYRMPLEAIGTLCEEHGARLFVDGIQAVGSMPIDVERLKIDFLSCGSHKWLMGVEGAGFLYVARRRRRELIARTSGWLSYERATSFLFEGEGHLRYDRSPLEAPRFVERATPNALGLAALGAAVDVLVALGLEEIEAHVSGYLDDLETELTARGFVSLRASTPEGRSCLLSVQPRTGTAVQWQSELTARGIICSVPDGLLRFAPHWPNGKQEIGWIAETLDEISRSRKTIE